MEILALTPFPKKKGKTLLSIKNHKIYKKREKNLPLERYNRNSKRKIRAPKKWR